MYGGIWKFVEEKSSWSFRSKESLAMRVSKDISYQVLLDQLYEEIGIDRSRVDIQLKVLYKFGGGDGILIPPTRISNDANLHTWLHKITKSINHRTPLCVTLMDRACPIIPEVKELNLSEIQSCVPETAEPVGQVGEIEPEQMNEYLPMDNNVEEDHTHISKGNDSCNDECDNDNFDTLSQLRTRQPVQSLQISVPDPRMGEDKSKTLGSASSQVRKVRSTEEHMWSCPIFSDNEIPESTTEKHTVKYNLESSSGVSSSSVKLGQVFENKQDLKTKLHLYAMKNNFEFKVKKSGTDV